LSPLSPNLVARRRRARRRLEGGWDAGHHRSSHQKLRPARHPGKQLRRVRVCPIEAITEDQFHKTFNVNVLGFLLTTQAAIKHLGEGASIINIGSVASRITPPNSAVYTGTKGAVDAITGALSRELGPKKIRVNTINPGVVETEGTHSGGVIGSEFEKAAIAQTPLGRIGQPGDIASIAVFLASEDSAWLTGEQLLATGGLR
jgi:3-oxoacyl-[acyl-carrier protein] reductase